MRRGDDRRRGKHPLRHTGLQGPAGTLQEPGRRADIRHRLVRPRPVGLLPRLPRTGLRPRRIPSRPGARCAEEPRGRGQARRHHDPEHRHAPPEGRVVPRLGGPRLPRDAPLPQMREGRLVRRGDGHGRGERRRGETWQPVRAALPVRRRVQARHHLLRRGAARGGVHALSGACDEGGRDARPRDLADRLPCGRASAAHAAPRRQGVYRQRAADVARRPRRRAALS